MYKYKYISTILRLRWIPNYILYHLYPFLNYSQPPTNNLSSHPPLPHNTFLQIPQSNSTSTPTHYSNLHPSLLTLYYYHLFFHFHIHFPSSPHSFNSITPNYPPHTSHLFQSLSLFSSSSDLPSYPTSPSPPPHLPFLHNYQFNPSSHKHQSSQTSTFHTTLTPYPYTNLFLHSTIYSQTLHNLFSSLDTPQIHITLFFNSLLKQPFYLLFIQYIQSYSYFPTFSLSS
jgi:hypothetical protein